MLNCHQNPDDNLHDTVSYAKNDNCEKIVSHEARILREWMVRVSADDSKHTSTHTMPIISGSSNFLASVQKLKSSLIDLRAIPFSVRGLAP